MTELAAQIEQAAAVISQARAFQPRVGIILGTGLGKLASGLQDTHELPYQAIPFFPASTAMGHAGQWISGFLGGVPVVAMQGRFHLYEGYSPRAASLPVRVMQRLGVEVLMVSNASGGLNPQFASGDVMVIEDQINWMWRNPLCGPHDERLGPRYPDMCRAYDPLLIDAAQVLARRLGFVCHRGVYAAMTGPTYETRAEYRMLRRLGADVVGMSTVPEVLVAVQAGMRVVGFSAVTNLCRPDTLESTSGEAVQRAAETAEPRLAKLVEALVADLAATWEV